MDRHSYAAPAIEPARYFIVFDAVDYVRDLLQTHRGAVAIGHDQRPEFSRIHELSIRLQRQVRVFAVERTGGRIWISVRDRRGYLIDSDAPIGKCLGIHLHPHRIFHRAVDLYLRYAFDHRDALRDQRLGVFVNLRQ